MLRQGKSAVQALHEVEVLTTDYVGDDTLLASADLVPQSGFSPMTVHTIVRGRLHLRTGNIGKLDVFLNCWNQTSYLGLCDKMTHGPQTISKNVHAACANYMSRDC